MKKKALVKHRKKAAPTKHAAPHKRAEPPPDIDIVPEVAPANNGAQVTPFDVLSGGGDLQTGYTFVDGEECNASKLNNAVNNAIVQAGFITSKPNSIPLATDSAVFLQGSSGQLKKTTLGAVAGLGPLKSVGLSMPADTFDVTHSPLTSDGTIIVSYDGQFANTVLIGPASGSAAYPTWRKLLPPDVSFPALGSGGTTIDWSASRLFYRQLASNTTFTFANIIDERILVVLEQTSGGSHLATWPSGIHWDLGAPPTLATVVGARDILEFFNLGTIGVFGKLWGRTT